MEKKDKVDECIFCEINTSSTFYGFHVCPSCEDMFWKLYTKKKKGEEKEGPNSWFIRNVYEETKEDTDTPQDVKGIQVSQQSSDVGEGQKKDAKELIKRIRGLYDSEEMGDHIKADILTFGNSYVALGLNEHDEIEIKHIDPATVTLTLTDGNGSTDSPKEKETEEE